MQDSSSCPSGVTKNKKNILVAGGAGFLGTHLVGNLLDDGHSVVSIDNLQTGCIRNARHHASHQEYKFIEHDIVNPIELDQQFDEIYNLACPASPLLYQKDPIHTLLTNISGSLNLLNIAKNSRSQVFFSSTSEVYGDPALHPQTEEYRGNVSTTGPRACYNEGKRCAEALHFDFARVHGVKIKVARIFNTYGPYMSTGDGRVVSNFIIQALQNQDLTVFGSGQQTRSYCYVDDQLDGFTKLMQSDSSFAGPVNLGNPEEISVLELADVILDLTGSRSTIAVLPRPADDSERRKPDITLAKERLTWAPKIPLRKGLQKTIQYFEEQLSLPSKETCL